MNDVVIVKVKNLLPTLIQTYGHYKHIELSKAVKGQKKGYWEIVGQIGSQGAFVDPRTILDDIHDDSYLVRRKFGAVTANCRVLTYRDVHQERTRP